MYVGQEKNLNIIKTWKQLDSMPRFLLIVGSEGSGRLSLAVKFAREIPAIPVIAGNSVEQVRLIIESAYTVTQPTVYIFKNADNMSLQAENALLKVTEEPPNNAYFIMTIKSLNNVLETIRSRADVMRMNLYSKAELSLLTEDSLILEYCETPAQVKYWKENKGLEEYISFCKKVVENIDVVSGVNALKIGSYLKYKDTDTGYDPEFFLNTIQQLYMKKLYADPRCIPFMSVIPLFSAISKAQHNIQLSKLKKESVIDTCILEIRDALISER